MNATWRYYNPVRLRFGDGILEQVAAATGGRNVTLVTFPEAASIGLVQRLRRILGPALVQVIDETQPNPDVASLDVMYRAFWADERAGDVLLAVGGGSAIDTAKALMVGTADGSFEALVALLATGKPFVPHRVRPLIAVPTTAGTGSEVTPWATIWDRGAGRKYSLHLDETWPEAALVDPVLTYSLPAGPTLAAGLDALSHALESIWNVNANPVSDTHAVAAARAVIATLPNLMHDLSNADLRRRMSAAALQAGLAFSNTKTALAHSISYEMTLQHGLSHGIACSFPLPMVLRRATGIDAKRDGVLAKVFGDDLDKAPAALARFLEDLGVSTHFESYGVKPAEEERLIAAALDGARGRNFIGAGHSPSSNPLYDKSPS